MPAVAFVKDTEESNWNPLINLIELKANLALLLFLASSTNERSIR